MKSRVYPLQSLSYLVSGNRLVSFSDLAGDNPHTYETRRFLYPGQSEMSMQV